MQSNISVQSASAAPLRTQQKKEAPQKKRKYADIHSQEPSCSEYIKESEEIIASFDDLVLLKCLQEIMDSRGNGA